LRRSRCTAMRSGLRRCGGQRGRWMRCWPTMSRFGVGAFARRSSKLTAIWRVGACCRPADIILAALHETAHSGDRATKEAEANLIRRARRTGALRAARQHGQAAGGNPQLARSSRTGAAQAMLPPAPTTFVSAWATSRSGADLGAGGDGKRHKKRASR